MKVMVQGVEADYGPSVLVQRSAAEVAEVPPRVTLTEGIGGGLSSGTPEAATPGRTPARAR